MPHNYAAEQIDQHKKALLDILDTLPSIIALVDRNGRVDLVNKRFEQFSGVSAADAKGLQLEALIPQFASDLQQVAAVIDRQSALDNARIQSGLGADMRYYSLQIYPLNSDVSGMAVIRIDDISELVRIEEIMAQTEKMIMVSGLAAGMAHEINNPLGAIMQHAQNIERRVSAEIPANFKAAAEVGVDLNLVRTYLQKRGIFDFIGHIRNAGIRASEIISQMLYFSSRNEPGVVNEDLTKVLERAVGLAATDYDMKKKYAFRSVEIVREYAVEPLCADIALQEIEQVLLNILKNAAQAISATAMSRQPQIILRTSTSGGMAVIEIEDNGPGMDEATRLRVFEPFFSTKEVGIGTGMGLSVAYAIVTKGHHGSIEVRSQPGEGSCFTLKLPLQGRG
ncbi:MAG: PAS domain S-box protein [Geobacteraceae bacterium]|nr:PAS domain S-box protein [Geobacteraceae bacterium]NTW81438.1 PAS domain S-box protein [Geobacteraceae bacterium]